MYAEPSRVPPWPTDSSRQNTDPVSFPFVPPGWHNSANKFDDCGGLRDLSRPGMLLLVHAMICPRATKAVFAGWVSCRCTQAQSGGASPYGSYRPKEAVRNETPDCSACIAVSRLSPPSTPEKLPCRGKSSPVRRHGWACCA